MVADKCPIGLIGLTGLNPNGLNRLNRPIGHYSSLVARRECQMK